MPFGISPVQLAQPAASARSSYREAYAAATSLLRSDYPEAPDFTVEPDAAIAADWCVRVAAAEWSARGCNARAGKGAVLAVTRAINGGTIGLAERRVFREFS